MPTIVRYEENQTQVHQNKAVETQIKRKYLKKTETTDYLKMSVIKTDI